MKVNKGAIIEVSTNEGSKFRGKVLEVHDNTLILCEQMCINADKQFSDPLTYLHIDLTRSADSAVMHKISIKEISSLRYIGVIDLLRYCRFLDTSSPFFNVYKLSHYNTNDLCYGDGQSYDIC